MNIQQNLKTFQTAHGKSYSSEAEEALRMNIFFERVAEIEQHNARFEAGEETFTMVINRFSDMVSKIYGFNILKYTGIFWIIFMIGMLVIYIIYIYIYIWPEFTSFMYLVRSYVETFTCFHSL